MKILHLGMHFNLKPAFRVCINHFIHSEVGTMARGVILHKHAPKARHGVKTWHKHLSATNQPTNQPILWKKLSHIQSLTANWDDFKDSPD